MKFSSSRPILLDVSCPNYALSHLGLNFFYCFENFIIFHFTFNQFLICFSYNFRAIVPLFVLLHHFVVMICWITPFNIGNLPEIWWKTKFAMSNESSANGGAGSRASNIQKILDRKQKIFQLPRNSKMVKISTYSTCEVKSHLKMRIAEYPWKKIFRRSQEKDCRCGGFKLNEEQKKRDESNYSPQSKDLCNNQNCGHPFRKLSYAGQWLLTTRCLLTVKHVCHLTDLTDEQLNKLLNNIVDMENLYISISRQDDMDIKKVVAVNDSQFKSILTFSFTTYRSTFTSRSSCVTASSLKVSRQWLFKDQSAIHRSKRPTFKRLSPTLCS